MKKSISEGQEAGDTLDVIEIYFSKVYFDADIFYVIMEAMFCESLGPVPISVHA